MPDPGPLKAIKERRERLRLGLAALYHWYERNAELTACVLRDMETHSLTREIGDLRFGPIMAAYGEVLGAGLPARQRALLRLALSFATWRTLAREVGLNRTAAVAAMVQAIQGETKAQGTA